MRSLYLLVLRCVDIERTKSFYEILGLTFAKHKHGNGPEHYAAEDEIGILELYPTETKMPDATGLGFLSEDIVALHTVFRKKQLAPREIRETEMGRTFIVRDPDGRRVEIKAWEEEPAAAPEAPTPPAQ